VRSYLGMRRFTPPHGMTVEHWVTHHARRSHPPVKT